MGEPRRSILIEATPFASASPSGVSKEMLEDEAWANQLAAEQAALERKRDLVLAKDQITYVLNAKYYIKDKSFPAIPDRFGMPLRVSRFYPEIDVAVDVFPSLDSDREKMVKEKRGLFKNVKIRYGYLDYSMEPVDLIGQVGVPRRVLP